jgi:mannose-6-phosphate isomerase-like protein (cupin superfamily)
MGRGERRKASDVVFVLETMKPLIIKQDLTKEFHTEERCDIFESANASNDILSIARARVEPGITTKWHAVEGTVERYIIAEGRGRVEIGDLPAQEVFPGDVVLIPAGTRQRIANTGPTDLIFYCVCTPPFRQSAYRQLE